MDRDGSKASKDITILYYIHLRNFEASSKRFRQFWHLLAAVFTPSDGCVLRQQVVSTIKKVMQRESRKNWEAETYLRYLEIAMVFVALQFTRGRFFDKNSCLCPTHVEAYQQQAEQVQADNAKKLKQWSVSESAEMGVNMDERTHGFEHMEASNIHQDQENPIVHDHSPIKINGNIWQFDAILGTRNPWDTSFSDMPQLRAETAELCCLCAKASAQCKAEGAVGH